MKIKTTHLIRKDNTKEDKPKVQVILLTTGQPTTNPRLVKEVDALMANGYVVQVFYSYWAGWAFEKDRDLLTGYPDGLFQLVGGTPQSNKLTYFISRVLHFIGKKSNTDYWRTRAASRTTHHLIRAAEDHKADIYIAHNLGALPAAVMAAKKYHAVCGFDAEDYHRGEFAPQNGKAYDSVKWLEEQFLPRCDYLTASSPLIAAAYQKLVNVKPRVVLNVFSKKHLNTELKRQPGSLSVFWFSQTVGPKRGLEFFIDAMNELKQNKISLYLMGDCQPEYKLELQRRITEADRLHFLEPAGPSAIFEIASQYDIGLAAEIPCTENRDYCLTNKIFTYLLAGNFILASDTSAQKAFMEQHPGIGELYVHNDVKSLTSILDKLIASESYLSKCKRNGLELASSEMNWEKNSEQFLSEIKAVMAN